MKLTKKFINQYNHPDTLLVISPYPKKGTTHTGGGVASYTKKTLLAIKNTNPNKKIVVLTNILNKKEVYQEKNILVIRCWQRNFPIIYLQILKTISKFNHVQDIMSEFEFAAYGDLLITGFFPLFTTLLRLIGKNITIVVHQVVKNLTDLKTHTGLTNKPITYKLLNQLLKYYYSLLALSSNQIITLEQNLAKRFNQITNSNKATSIPHGLNLTKSENKTQAKKNLNLSLKTYYILAFGYLSHYKGTDLLVKAFQKPLNVNNKPVKLILAGSQNPTQGNKPHYQKFYSQLFKKINQNPNIIHTGFVPDDQITNYFSASDITIFPYRTFMSASGPLAIALAHQKPIIVSNKLKHYSSTTINLDPQNIRNTIVKTLKNKILQNKLVSHSKNLAQQRDFDLQGQKYLNLTSNKSESAIQFQPIHLTTS
jgi:glycosyltransferase involved in cell wall biosynthesis